MGVLNKKIPEKKKEIEVHVLQKSLVGDLNNRVV